MKKDKELQKLQHRATVWPKGFIIPGNKDPLGSYTGIAMDPYETPVQDADDL